ncbi:OsmC family protein [Dyella halodurans]
MEAIVSTAQKPLRAMYKVTPAAALVTDHARTCGDVPSDPFHSKVEPMDGCGVVVPIGTHAAVGGPHDSPTPGDMLCAALAACQDSTMRLIANLLGVELTSLQVSVTATVDVRGCMAVDPNVPVGFQTMACDVRFTARTGTSTELIEKLKLAAERSCIVQQTLKSPPPIVTTFITSDSG